MEGSTRRSQVETGAAGSRSGLAGGEKIMLHRSIPLRAGSMAAVGGQLRWGEPVDRAGGRRRGHLLPRRDQGEGRYKRMVLFLERTSSSFFLSYHSPADSHTKTSLSQLLPHLTEVHTKDHWPTTSSPYYLLAPSACSPACCLLPLVKPCHT